MLRKIYIEGLFDEFNYEIELKEEARQQNLWVSILYESL